MNNFKMEMIMKSNRTYSFLGILFALTFFCGTAWGTDYTYDMHTSTASSGGDVTNWYSNSTCTTHYSKTTNGTNNLIVSAGSTTMYYKDATIAATAFGVYAQTKAYFTSSSSSATSFFMGQKDSYITLPTYSNQVITNVKVATGGSCAKDVAVNVYSSSTAASTQLTTVSGKQNLNFAIGSSYQATTLKIQILTASKNIQIDTIVVTTAAACDKSVTVSNGGSSTNGAITSITTSPVATCSSTASDRRVSIVVTPSTGYVAPTALTVGSTTGTVNSSKISRTDNGNGTFTFVYEYNQNDNGAISYNAACVGKQCTVTFDKNSGTGGDNSVTATYGSAMTSITPPTREHYDFAGYYDSETNNDGTGNKYYNANGTSAATWNKNTTSNTTLYAKWTEHSLINYRTVCCTELGDIDGDVNITTDGCDPGEIKVTWKMEATTGIASQTLRVYDENVDEVTAKRITSITPSTSNQTKTISGLDPCKDYLVTIENVSSGGSYCAAGAPWTSDVVTTLGYSITYNTPNITLSSGTEVKNSCSADDVDVAYTANDGYHLPTSITVTNAGDEDDNWTWDAANGEFIILDLSAVTGDVVVNIAGQLDACDDYSFFYGTTKGSENNFECFSFVTGSTDTWLTDIWTIPSSDQWTYVGEPDWDPSSGKSANLQLSSMPYALNHANNLGSISTGVMEGAEGYVKICTNSSDANRYVGFIPAGYVFRWGTDGSGWSSIAFTGKTSAIEEEDWYTPLQTWTSSNADDYTYVGLKTSNGYVWANRSETRRPVFLKPTSAWDKDNAYFATYYFDASSHTGWSAIMTDPDGDGIYEAWIPDTYTYTTVNFVRLSTATADWNNKWNQTGNITLPSDKNVFTITGGSDDAYTGEWSLYDKKGTFHISANSNTNNWYCHFLPHHVLHYDANSGSGAPADQTIAVNASPCQLTVSTTEPTRTGYTFAGWNESSSAAAKDDDWDGGDTHTMSADVTLYAVWTANTNTPYTVKHYKQKLDGTYDSTPDDTDNLTGTTATSVTPDRKSYTGFTAPDAQTETIAADGSLVIEYKYTRNSYTLAWSLDGGSISVAGTTAGSVKYEASLTAPTVTKTGYTFSAWSPSVPSTMPAANSTYTATWTANTNTAYTVEHYKQKLDGTYPASADETDNLTGTTATSVTPDRKSYTGFTAPSGQTETIAADGSLVIVYKYTRNKYNVAVASVGNVTITATPSGGSAIAESANADVYYGQSVTLAKSSISDGYYWQGWKVTKQSDDTDVTASVVSTNTLTVPAYAINVSAGLYTNAIAWCDPDVEVTGDVHLTSAKSVYVHSTGGADNLLNIASTDLGSATSMKIAYLDADDSDAEKDKDESLFRLYNSTASAAIDASSSTIDVSASRTFNTDYSIKYTPAEDGVINNYKLQLKLFKGEKELKTVTHAIYGRSLPEEFAIVFKNTNDSKWYTLPSNLAGTQEAQDRIGLSKAIEVEVDNTTTPTKVVLAPNTRIYKGTGRNTATNNINGIRFTNDGSHWLQTGSSVNKLWLSGSNSDNNQVFYLKSTDFNTYELAMDPSQSPTKKLGVYSNAGEFIGYAASIHSNIYFLPIEKSPTELMADATDWTDDIIQLTAEGVSDVSATKIVAVNEDGSVETSKVAFSTPATDTYLADFNSGIDFTGLTNEMLTLEWYNNSDELVGLSWAKVPSIILAGDNDEWSDFAYAPTLDDIVVLSKPMTIDVNDPHAKAKQIVMDQSGDNTGKLTIQPSKGLEVASTVKVYNGSALGATTEADLVLESSSSEGNASLIFNNSNACQATVQQYSKAAIVGDTWNWQYVGTPFTGSIPGYNYYGSWMYKWDKTDGWLVVHGGDELTPFAGYCLTQESATTHVMGGTLVATDGNDQTITMGEETDMVLANSWTAPIWIGGFTTEGEGATFTSEPATIYLFNTGSAEDGSKEGTTTEAGTYNTVPVNSGPYFGTELIPSMQGFFVTTVDGSAGTITLKYDELVRPDKEGYRTSITTGQMYAPRRAKAVENKPAVMKIMANGSKYSDRVVILERTDFSNGFDNGWDGEKLSFGAEAPSVYVINEQGGYDAVSAIPSLEGTVVGFRAGTNDSCTISFEFDGDETLYLNDLQAQQSTLIDAEQTYTFSTSGNDNEARFIISATPITKVPTGIEHSVVSGQPSEVRKIIINDKLFIIRGGRMYSAEGQMVK